MLKRLLPWLAGTWLFLQGVAQLWPTLTRQTIPEWLSTWKLPGLPSLDAGADVLGWLSTTIGAAILLTLVFQRRSRAGTATSDQRRENDALAALQEEARKNRSAVADRDALRKALEDTQQDRERIRGLLGTSEEAVRACKREFAQSRLRWFADRAKRNIEIDRLSGQTIPDVRVTLRFAVYSDLDLVQKVAKILKESTDWPVEIDGSNKPTLMPDSKGFKVVFDVGPMRTFDEIASAFSDGEFLGPSVKVGARATDRFNEMEHLIIEVLPITS